MLPRSSHFILLVSACAMLCGCAHYEAGPLSPAQTSASLEARSLTAPELREFLRTNLGREFAEWPPKAWDFEALSWVAFHFHPSLDVARAQWDVARGGTKTAAARPNPTISATPGYNFSAANGVSPWFPGVNVDLPVETAGKRGKRMAQSRLTAEAARQNVFTAAWQVRAELRRALLEYQSAERRGRVLRDQAAIQGRTVDMLEQRLQAGAASALDASAARIASAKTEAEAGDAGRQLATARARLAQTLGVPLSALAGQYFEEPFGSMAPELSSADLLAARRNCLQSRPDILAALAAYEASQAALELEIAKQYPDIHLGSGYQWDQGDDKWSLAVSLELPVLNRNQGPIAEAEARRRESAAQFIATQARVIAELDSALAEHSGAEGQILGLEKIQAALKAQADMVHRQLEAGGADLLEDASAQLELGLGQLALLDAQAKAALAAGRLEAALQIPFAHIQSLENSPRPLTQSQIK